jgi:hypothetical protein
MWYPTKVQWSVIWMTTVIFLIAWLRSDPSPEAFIMPAALVCVLFFWQVSAGLWGTRD